MNEQLYRPDWVKRINLFGKVAGSAELLIPLDAGELKQAAINATELNDVGDMDWEVAFERLIHSLEGVIDI